MIGFKTHSGMVFLLDTIKNVGIGKNAKKIHTFKPSEPTYQFVGKDGMQKEYNNPTLESESIEFESLRKQFGCIEIIK
jgi:hypothetical protein